MRVARGLGIHLVVMSVALGVPSSVAAKKEVGLNTHLSPIALDVAQAARVQWVRIEIPWDVLQPAPNDYAFGPFDGLVDLARSKGLNVLLLLGGTPAWASAGDAKGDGPSNDVPRPGLYEGYVSAVVTHFKTRVTHYEVSNEPNVGGFWEGSRQEYVERILVPASA